MTEDLEPPSFEFGRGERDREERRSREREPLDDDLLEPEIIVRRTGDEEAPKPKRRLRLVPEMSETTSRVVVAIPWIVFAVAIVGAGGAVFAAAMIVLGILGLREFFRMAEPEQPIMLPAYAVVAGMVIAAHYGSAFQILLVFAAIFPLAFAFAAARRSHEAITISIAFTILGVAWMGIGFSHAVLLRDLPLHGGALLIDVLVATFLGDTAAYAAGRLFGSRKMTPRISPNKTLEGGIGGFVGATMGFWFAGLYQDWLPGVDALLMGMCIGVIAPIGDLFASLIKRDLGVKDTGRLFGPHGGLIDRLDAVLFTVVIGYYLSVAFVY
ncbi:MAG: phosphatidate cytidylyltransferase [Solirubrobacterales bacterium]|jgi:phosphatidate cytidylyltransferase|nr:phosphatidate cytidylyltransferase [Solirubrobacterales bacterium]